MSNLVDKLKFKESEKLFVKGSKVMESVHQGKFTKRQILSTLQEIASDANDHNLPMRLGVFYHYEEHDYWAPAVLRNSNETQTIWGNSDGLISDVDDSIFDNDTINEVVFVVMNHKKITEAGGTLHKAHTLKKDKKERTITKNVFSKK